MPKVFDIMLLEKPEQHILYIQKTTTINHVADLVIESFYKLNKHITNHNIIPSDVPFVAYDDWRDMFTKPFTVSVGFPLSCRYDAQGDISAGVQRLGRVVCCAFRGPYSQTSKIYNEMNQWATSRKMQLAGDCYEYYYNGPDFPEEEYITKVVFPVKN